MLRCAAPFLLFPNSVRVLCVEGIVVITDLGFRLSGGTFMDSPVPPLQSEASDN